MGNIVPKTAIDYFKQERNKNTEPYRPFYDAAIEALEKRELKKVLEETKFYGNGKCPSCDAVFLDKSTDFCGNCGQALDWRANDDRA